MRGTLNYLFRPSVSLDSVAEQSHQSLSEERTNSYEPMGSDRLVVQFSLSSSWELPDSLSEQMVLVLDLLVEVRDSGYIPFSLLNPSIDVFFLALVRSQWFPHICIVYNFLPKRAFLYT